MQGSMSIPPPQIINQTGNNIVPPSSNVTLLVVTQGEGQLRYQWFFNGSPLPDQNQASITI
ncbi:MAG: hypothetical protein M2R45_04017 [Verrucomicrobia subdivision 3 bacterium]|nr:hypothetical protein [Limisphaerales bacterium]MCS1416232.1 hypothetical protein [Limisphaerales bacterium]